MGMNVWGFCERDELCCRHCVWYERNATIITWVKLVSNLVKVLIWIVWCFDSSDQAIQSSLP